MDRAFKITYTEETYENLIFSKVKLGLSEGGVIDLALRLLRHACEHEKIMFKDGETLTEVKIV